MVHQRMRVGRIILALVFVYAAWTKLRQPWEVFALSIDSYGVLPEWAVVATARALPWCELALGVLLLLGVQLVAVSGAVSLLLVGFMAAMLRAWSLDLGIDCGCFGVGQAVSPETLARDGALTLLSLGVTAGAIVSRRRATLPGTRLDAEVEASGGQACISPVATAEAPTAAGAAEAEDKEERP